MTDQYHIISSRLSDVIVDGEKNQPDESAVSLGINVALPERAAQSFAALIC